LREHYREPVVPAGRSTDYGQNFRRMLSHRHLALDGREGVIPKGGGLKGFYEGRGFASEWEHSGGGSEAGRRTGVTRRKKNTAGREATFTNFRQWKHYGNILGVIIDTESQPCGSLDSRGCANQTRAPSPAKRRKALKLANHHRGGTEPRCAANEDVTRRQNEAAI